MMLSIVLILLGLMYFGDLSNSFMILSMVGVIVVIAYSFRDLYKKAWILYSIAFIISVLGMIFVKDYYFRILQGGLLGYSFLFVVMMVGVLPNKLTLTRNIKRNRGMFSILAFIFISSHAYMNLFTEFGVLNLYGLAAYMIMVPLTLISFRIVRKEIPPKDWFRIQKAAYVIYGILFIHIFLVSANENKIVYAVFAALYINNKLIKEFKK